MSSKRGPDIPSGGLALEPLESEKPTVLQPAGQAPAKFSANTRKRERRENSDRREMLRFEDDRRTGKDRRPRRTWQPGKNL